MTNFGLVVLGAHIGIHIKGEIEKILPEKVLLVEPVPHNVVEIKKNLNNLEGITIEQVALSDKNETRNFYFVKNTSIHKLKKHWSSGIGSFNKSEAIRPLGCDISAMRKEPQESAISLNFLKSISLE